MGRIQTVLGDMQADELGHCQIHEHIWVDETPASLQLPQLRIDNYAASLAELNVYYQNGGRAIVDAQPVGAGRDIKKLADLSAASNVHIVATTGFHRPKFYAENHWIHTVTTEEARILFIRELVEGAFLDGQLQKPEKQSTNKAGIAKAALGSGRIDEWTHRLLLASGLAAIQTGFPLMIHTESGNCAVEAIGLLNELGLKSERVIVCHVDRQAENLAPHLNIAKTGANLDYDTIHRLKYHDDASEIELIQHMVSAGHLNKIMLALDTTAERLESYGGSIGLSYLLNQFRQEMLLAGISGEAYLQMTITNPARLLVRDAVPSIV
jgi:phosphotriesterase-related protein